MSEHDERAEQVEQDVAGMEHDSDRLGKHADEAREKLEQSNSDELIPEALGPRDPSWSESQPTDDESAEADINFEHGSEKGDDEDPQYSGGDAERGAATD